MIGTEGFAEKALERFERLSGEDSLERKRADDRYFDPLAKVIQDCGRLKGIVIDKINVGKYAG